MNVASLDRYALLFAEKVKNYFNFLEALGFRLVEEKPTLVRYESSSLGINVYHGRQSYEIGLEVEELKDKEPYTVFEVLKLSDPDKAISYRNYVAYTVSGVDVGVLQLAELFRACTDSKVLSDKDCFSKLKILRGDIVRDYWFGMELRQAVEDSKSAWNEKDFEKVVTVLSPIHEHLAPSDLKKLEYAKNHRQ